MTQPDVRPGAPVTFKKDYLFTPENIAKKLGIYISSPDQLPSVERTDLEGKVALITGSTRGIGAATARVFGEYGMKVVVNGRRETEEGAQVVKDVISNGGDAVFIPGNVSSFGDAERVVDESVKHFGRLDVLVNNVGIRKDNLVVLMSPDQVYDVMETNFYSAAFTTEAAVKRMMRNKNPQGGMIIYNSSVGEAGFPGQSIYAASKRAMEAHADVVAQEYAKRNVLTSIIRPGLVTTDLTSDLTPAQIEELSKLPKGGPMVPEDVARCMPFLAALKESGHVLTLA